MAKLAADIQPVKKFLKEIVSHQDVAAECSQDFTDPALVEAITNAAGVNFISQVGRDLNLT